MTRFEQFECDDVRALIETYPLAWVCGSSSANMEASLLPLVGVYGDDGDLVQLIGHMGRSNPLHAALVADPHATILFKGPDAYVSPEHARRRNWGPTWNYVQLKISAEIVFDPLFTETSLRVLLDAVESGRAQPWNADELGARYEGMLAQIIGFRACVTNLSGRFKLGQDEAPGTLQSILGSLPDAATVSWMRRFNAGRL